MVIPSILKELTFIIIFDIQIRRKGNLECIKSNDENGQVYEPTPIPSYLKL